MPTARVSPPVTSSITNFMSEGAMRLTWRRGRERGEVVLCRLPVHSAPHPAPHAIEQPDFLLLYPAHAHVPSLDTPSVLQA